MQKKIIKKMQKISKNAVKNQHKLYFNAKKAKKL